MKIGKGWRNEPLRHSLARKGVKTGRKTKIKYERKPSYVKPKEWNVKKGSVLQVFRPDKKYLLLKSARTGFVHEDDVRRTAFKTDDKERINFVFKEKSRDSLTYYYIAERIGKSNNYKIIKKG